MRSSAARRRGDVFTPVADPVVLSSAAASTQTTILPNRRTTLSMAVYARSRASSRGSTRATGATTSTILMGAVSAVLYGRHELRVERQRHRRTRRGDRSEQSPSITG